MYQGAVKKNSNPQIVRSEGLPQHFEWAANFLSLPQQHRKAMNELAMSL
jgi:hypothetical protein